MLDVYSDMTQQAAAFGNHFELLEMCELHDLRQSVTAAQAKRKVAEFRRAFDVSSDCQPAELERAVGEGEGEAHARRRS